MSKHTAGPWTNEEGDITGIENDPENGCVGKVDVAHVYMRVVPGRSEANARLIAAAPELLEALRIAREIVVTERDAAHQGVVNPSTGVIDDSDDADWVAEYDRALAQIDEAIAKATGEKA